MSESIRIITTPPNYEAPSTDGGGSADSQAGMTDLFAPVRVNNLRLVAEAREELEPQEDGVEKTLDGFIIWVPDWPVLWAPPPNDTRDPVIAVLRRTDVIPGRAQSRWDRRVLRLRTTTGIRVGHDGRVVDPDLPVLFKARVGKCARCGTCLGERHVFRAVADGAVLQGPTLLTGHFHNDAFVERRAEHATDRWADVSAPLPARDSVMIQ